MARNQYAAFSPIVCETLRQVSMILQRSENKRSRLFSKRDGAEEAIESCKSGEEKKRAEAEADFGRAIRDIRKEAAIIKAARAKLIDVIETADQGDLWAEIAEVKITPTSLLKDSASRGDEEDEDEDEDAPRGKRGKEPNSAKRAEQDGYIGNVEASVTELELGPASTAALQGAKLTTLGKLLAYIDDGKELSDIGGIGPVLSAEIVKAARAWRRKAAKAEIEVEKKSAEPASA